MFTSSVIDAMSENNDILLQGFGKFYKLKFPARIGRNPNTAPVEEDPKMLIWDFCILIS